MPSGAASARAWRTTRSTPTRSISTSDAALCVNLFIPSELTWREQGLDLRQETRFPDEDSIRLTFTAEQPTRLALQRAVSVVGARRHDVAVNGQAVASSSDARVVRHGLAPVAARRRHRRPSARCACGPSRCPATRRRSRSSTGRCCWPATSAATGLSDRHAIRHDDACALEAAAGDAFPASSGQVAMSLSRDHAGPTRR